ncbi:MAG TPA: hypothetical protein VMZ92_04995 [Planctomycetota bacterium]|nr:hypothetical protein [Planctomycetota bacterium]
MEEQVVEDAEKVRVRAFRNRTDLIFVIGVLFALYVVVGGILCFFAPYDEVMDWDRVAWSLPVFAALAALFLSVGVGLFRTREWARKAGMVLCWVCAAVFAAIAVRIAVGGCWLVLRTAPWELLPSWRLLIAALLIAVLINILSAYAMVRIGLYLRSDEAKEICEGGGS